MRALRFAAWCSIAILIACGREGAGSPTSASTGPSDGGSSQAPADAGPAASLPDPPAEASPWPQPIGADQGFWIPVGPGGAAVYQVAVKPDDARIALAGTTGRLFRTTNGGVRWQDTGLRPSLGIQAVAFSPVEPQRAWAVDLEGFVYSSTDAGATWTGPDKSLSLLVPGYSIAQLVPHAGSAAVLSAATASGLYVSHDAGKSWAVLWAPKRDFDGTSGVCALAFQPGSPATMLSGPCGYSYARMYRSTDAGATWSRLETDFGGVTAVTFDPTHPDTAYAGLDYGGLPAVIRSNDGGRTWSHDGYGGVPWTVRTLSVSGDGALWGGLWFKGVAVSRDGAKTWSNASIGIPARSSAWLAMHPKTRSPFLAGISGESNGGGIYRATPDGWRRSSAGMLAENVGGLAWTAAGRLYAATDSGLFATDDGGASWTGTAFDQGTTSVAIDAENTIYLADYFMLHRSNDGGRSWNAFQMQQSGAHLVLDSRTLGRLYAHAFGLSRSDDAGASWRTLIPGGGVSTFAVDPKEPLRLYAWSVGYARGADGSFIIVNPGLKRSEDGGATWVPSGQGLPADVDAVGIVPDPVHAGRIFLALAHRGNEGRKWGAIYRSDDAGLSWFPVLRHEDDLVQAVALAPAGALFAAFESALLRSVDGGGTWRTVAEGHAAIGALLSHPIGSAIYAATSGDSVLRVVPRQ